MARREKSVASSTSSELLAFAIQTVTEVSRLRSGNVSKSRIRPKMSLRPLKVAALGKFSG